MDNEEDGNTFPGLEEELVQQVYQEEETPDFNTKAYVKLTLLE